MNFTTFNSYQITEEKHKHFLLEERNDPVTGDIFSEGDEVVFCSSCKSAFLKDSWVYMGNKHCDQKATLPIFPKSKRLILQKPIELSFVFVDTDNRSAAFFVDIFIIASICFIIAIIDIKLNINIHFYTYTNLALGLFVFRDSILINKSIGKSFQKMYFIDVNTKLPATIWQTLGRNLLYWVMNGIFALAFTSTLTLRNHIEDMNAFLVFIGATFLIINFCYLKQNIEKKYSWFDELLGLRLVKKK